MHILMTGGTGLIGTASCAALHAAGHTLTILSRRGRPATDEATYVTALSDCAEPVDAVINLAGAGLADRRWSNAYKRQIVSSRVDLTRELVAWLGECNHPPSRLISASAIGYYGAAEEQAFTESSEPGTGFAAALCQSWESEAVRAAECGAQVSLLRFGVVLAREGGAKPAQHVHLLISCLDFLWRLSEISQFIIDESLFTVHHSFADIGRYRCTGFTWRASTHPASTPSFSHNG